MSSAHDQNVHHSDDDDGDDGDGPYSSQVLICLRSPPVEHWRVKWKSIQLLSRSSNL